MLRSALYKGHLWSVLYLGILGQCFAAGVEADWLTGQSCAVRCAGYLEQRLLDCSSATPQKSPSRILRFAQNDMGTRGYKLSRYSNEKTIV